MRKWVAGWLLCAALSGAWAQEDQKGRANALYDAGKRVEALLLYEELAKQFPNEWLYAERLADCLAAKSAQTSNPGGAEVSAHARARCRQEEDRAGKTGREPAQPGPASGCRMLDCWILIGSSDEGVARDYPAYRKEHRQLLHDYIERFVLHEGTSQPQ